MSFEENRPSLKQEGELKVWEYFDKMYLQSVRLVRSRAKILNEEIFPLTEGLRDRHVELAVDKALILRDVKQDYAFIAGMVGIGPRREIRLMIARANQNGEDLDVDRLLAVINQPVYAKQSVSFHSDRGVIMVNCARIFRSVFNAGLDMSSRDHPSPTNESYHNSSEVVAQVLGF